MKNAIYSSKLEHIYKDLSLDNNINLSKYNTFKNNIASISSLYKNEQNYLNKYATNASFRKTVKKRMSHYKYKNQLTDVVLGFISKKNLTQMKYKLKNGKEEIQEICIDETLHDNFSGFLNNSPQTIYNKLGPNKTDLVIAQDKKTLLQVKESGKEAFDKIVSIIDNSNTKQLEKENRKSRNIKDLIKNNTNKSLKIKSSDTKQLKVKEKSFHDSLNSPKLNTQPILKSPSVKTSSTFFRSTKENTAVPNLELNKESFNTYCNTEENLNSKEFINLADSNRKTRNDFFLKLKQEEVSSKSLPKDKNKYVSSSFAPRKSVQAIQPKFNSTEGLNNFVIRNFLIRDKNDPLEASKNQFKISQNFFFEKEEKTKAKKLKDMAKYEETTGKQVFLDQIFAKKDNSYIDDEEEYPEHFQGANNFIKKHNKKLKLKTIENSRNFADLIHKISCVEYQSMGDSAINNGRINMHNLSKVVRLRTVLKTKKDPEIDETEIQSPAKIKEMVQKNQDEVIKALKKLGPPSFLKNKFKTATLNRFKVVNGKYFGC